MAYDGSIKFSIDIDQDLAEDKLNELKSNLDDMANELSKKDLKYGEKLASDFDKTNQSIAETINKLREAEAQLERIQFDMQDWESTGGGENLELTQAYESARMSVNELKQSLNDMIPQQQSLTNRAMVFNDKIIESKNNSVKLSKETDNVSKAMNRSSRSAKSISDNIGGGVKKVLRYGLALFSIRSIYTMLSRLSREWMNSNDVEAKQMNANVQALSNGLQNLLAPILQTIMGWITTLMGYVNALTKAFFGVSIFTAKTNKNLGGSVGNAKKLSKEAKKFTASFDDAEVATSKMSDNLAGGGGGTGVGDLPAPNIPEPNVDWIVNWVDKLIKALDPFIQTMKSIDFKPLEKAFQNLANVGKQSAKIIGDSFVRVMNNSVAPFIKLLMEDIVPEGLNTVARILERLNPVIDRLLKDFVEPLIHWFLLDFVPVGLNLVFKVMEALGGILAVVIESFNEFWDSSIGRAISFVAGELVLAIMEDLTTIFNEIIESVDFFFEALEEGEPFATGLAWAIGLIVSALVAWKIAQAGINAVTLLFNSISPFGWLVIAITAVIAVILVLYKNWDNIVEFFKETLAKIGQWFADRWQGIKDGFSNLVQSIKDWWNNTIQSLKDGWQSFLDKGKDVISGIRNFFTGMIDWLVSKTGFFGQYWSEIIGGMLSGIKKVINNIKGVFRGFIDFIAGVFTGDWARAWRGVVSIFENIIKGIVNIFKFPINAMIDGLNFFIRGVNRIKIPNWVPAVGGKGINIGQIPRLAKGGVLNRPTLNIAGEAGKEAVVPLENNTGWAKDFLNVLDGYGGVGNSQPQVIQLVVDSKVLAEVVNEQNEESKFSRNGGGMAWSM